MRWVEQLFARRRRYDELSQSIQEHLEEKIADLMDRDMTRAEAERTARRELAMRPWSNSAAGRFGNGPRSNPFLPISALHSASSAKLQDSPSLPFSSLHSASPPALPSSLLSTPPCSNRCRTRLRRAWLPYSSTLPPAPNARSPIRTIRIGRAPTPSSNRSRSGHPTLIFGVVLPGLNLCA